MVSRCGRFVLCFNGEIYNHVDLRAAIDTQTGGEGFPWRGHSDTEVLLESLAAWGLETTLPKLNGMFAFALWDRDRRKLVLARDRMGEKPLYYGINNGVFLFGSELKALKRYPGSRFDLNRDAVGLFLRHSCVPSPHAIFKGIFKLPPATYTVLDPEGLDRHHLPDPVCYWNLRDIAEKGILDPEPGDEEEMEARLDALLRDAVRRRMEADVPLGAFLSGGIDSSLVVALMQQESTRPVKTFSIGFHEPDYDEAVYARQVANHLQTDHTEHYLSSSDALETIPLLPTLYDEPFSDSSQIPTFLVSRLARNRVTVSLSGDGGDELFAGYGRYRVGNQLWAKAVNIPGSWRGRFASLLEGLPEKFVLANERWLSRLLGVNSTDGWLPEKLSNMAGLLKTPTPALFYRRLVSHWTDPELLIPRCGDPFTVFSDEDQMVRKGDFCHLMMYLDQKCYLPEDILTKVDRASMGVSLEARIPFLDHRVVELSWKVSNNLKIGEECGKIILRRLLDRYVPRNLTERPKQGFVVPIEKWLRGPLRDWAESLLDEWRLRKEGIFNPEPIRGKWEGYLAGKHHWHFHLWDVLMFQAWNENE